MEAWSTASEIDFIRRLGTHQKDAPTRVEDASRKKRLSLLTNYEQAIALRKRWGAIDKNEVEKEVNRLIAELS